MSKAGTVTLEGPVLVGAAYGLIAASACARARLNLPAPLSALRRLIVILDCM